MQENAAQSSTRLALARPSGGHFEGRSALWAVLAARQGARLELEAARLAFVHFLLAEPGAEPSTPAAPTPRLSPAASPPLPSRNAIAERAGDAVTPGELALGLVAGWQADLVEQTAANRSALLERHSVTFEGVLSCAFRNADVADDAPPPLDAPFTCPPEICVGRRLLSPGHARALAALVALSPSVRKLDLADVRLPAESALLLAGALRFAPALRALSLAGNVLVTPATGGLGPGVAAVRALAAELGRAESALTALDLSHCQLGDSGAHALARTLHCSGLVRLSLASNQISDDGAAALALSLEPLDSYADTEQPQLQQQQQPQPQPQPQPQEEQKEKEGAGRSRSGACSARCGLPLQELDLSHNLIGPAGADSFALALHRIANARASIANARASRGGGAARLRVLALTKNKLTIDAASVLARAASGACRSLSDLRRWGAAEPGGARSASPGSGALALPDAPSAPPTPQTSPLRRAQPIGLTRHAIALSTLSSPPSILSCEPAPSSVAISCVRDADVHLIAHDLRTDRFLTSLRLSGSRLSDTSALALALALRANVRLLELDLMGNSLANAAAAALGEALRAGRNSSLQLLNLANNCVADDGAAALAAALAENSSLRTLDLARNRLADDCAAPLAAALAHNRTILSLQLGGNGLGAEARAIIRAAWDGRVLPPASVPASTLGAVGLGLT